MPSVNVKVKFSTAGGTTIATAFITVQVNGDPPSETEVGAAIQKRFPHWSFVILNIGSGADGEAG